MASTIETFDSKLLDKYRKLFFPVIGDNIITGYNVYKNMFKSTAPFLVNYLHSDLGFDAKGRPHRHREELQDKLSKFGPMRIMENITSSIVDRIAVYKIGDWEENPEGLKFYDGTGKKLSAKELATYRGLLIAEGKQYDMGIELQSRKDLEHILDFFNKYVYAHKIDKMGNLLYRAGNIVMNEDAIAGSWEIPLITAKGRGSLNRTDYKKVFEVDVKENEYDITALVDKQLRRLKSALKDKGALCLVAKKFANRPFVELYLNQNS